MKKGAIFDMDGLLFDTERLFRDGWGEMARKFGQVPHADFPAAVAGTSGDGMRAVIRQYYPEVDTRAFQEGCISYTADILRKRLPEKPGMREILVFFREHRVKIAVASSSGQSMIRDNLQRAGIKTYFDAVTHIDDGFDLLGWTFRKYKGKLIIKPSKKAIKAFKANLHDTILGQGKAWEQDMLIRKLNQQIRGWTNYHQAVCASKAYSNIDYTLFQILWRWAKRRHPKKGRKWTAARYWHQVGTRNWVFSTENQKLLTLGDTPIIRHPQMRISANPYLDPQYFIDRKFKHGMKRLSGRFKKVWKNQNGCCFHCGLPIDIGEDKEIFYKVPIAMGGKDDVNNMAYVIDTAE